MSSIKQFAIIAAGEGSRLSQEGITLPKPLVSLHDEVMIDRLIRIFVENGADHIVVIANPQQQQTVPHLQLLAKRYPACKFDIVAKTTPSSMHSFEVIADYLDDAPFCLTTVDTIFAEADFKAYLDFCSKQSGADGVMAVTDYIDDEKPLYIDIDAQGNILDFCDEQGRCTHISGGIYTLKPQALATLRRCINEGQHRMRNYQRGLIADGLQLRAFKFSKILDVDHAGDIAKAEEFLATQ